MSHAHETIVAVEKKYVLHFSLCVFVRARAPACMRVHVSVCVGVGARAQACA